MHYEKRTRVKAPRRAVAEFHSTPAGFKALNPFFVPIILHESADPLVSGSEMEFTLFMGPVPVRWRARIEDASVEGFTDIQVKGPFKSWRHRHNFIALDANTTEVQDVIEAEMPDNPIKWVAASMMWLGLPVLWLHRAAATRRALEGEEAAREVGQGAG